VEATPEPVSTAVRVTIWSVAPHAAGALLVVVGAVLSIMTSALLVASAFVTLSVDRKRT
jgi:hypothetical protein